MSEYISRAELHKNVCKNIKKFRMQAKLTQEELSETVGISHDYLRRMESEKGQKDFTFYTLYKISLALNLKIDDLI